MDDARTNGQGSVLAPLTLGAAAKMVGYLALKKYGRITGSLLETAVAVRRALLAGCEVHSDTGAVTWRGGPVALPDRAARRFLQRAVDRLLDDEKGAGVDVDLAEGALELQEALAARPAPASAAAAVTEPAGVEA